jgi:hypothetical protein
MRELAEWDSFYVILGSAAGALIGLQFVVMTLLAEHPPKGVAEGSQAFTTPTVLYFSAVLLICALMRVPWPGSRHLAAVLGVVGLAGVVYVGIVIRRMIVQTAYRPETEDWIFHAILPLAAFAIIIGGAAELDSQFLGSAFGVAGAVLLLLFTGVHNSWDGVVYHVLVLRHKQRERDTEPD